MSNFLQKKYVFKVYCFNILSFNFIFLFNGLIIMILCFQLIVHGQVLNTICHNKLKDLMIIARQVLLKENLPLTSRQFLLYGVDLENRNFGQLPTNLQKFYMS